jgi:uncharacterized protein (DUF1330 family)
MSVYVIASLTIKDAASRRENGGRTLLPTMAKYGARLVARGGPIVLEGRVAARTANHRRVPQHRLWLRVF